MIESFSELEIIYETNVSTFVKIIVDISNDNSRQ